MSTAFKGDLHDATVHCINEVNFFLGKGDQFLCARVCNLVFSGVCDKYIALINTFVCPLEYRDLPLILAVHIKIIVNSLNLYKEVTV